MNNPYCITTLTTEPHPYYKYITHYTFWDDKTVTFYRYYLLPNNQKKHTGCKQTISFDECPTDVKNRFYDILARECGS